MFSIFLAIIIGFIFGVFLTSEPGPGIGFAVLFWFLAGLAACENIEKGDEEYAVRDTVEIQSAATGSSLEGDFFLGSGTVEGKRYYAYWTPEDTKRRGAVERRKVSEKNWDVEIIESDSVDSKIIFTEYKKKETPWKIYFDSPYQRAEIFVPEGSIRYNYNISATE